MKLQSTEAELGGCLGWWMDGRVKGVMLREGIMEKKHQRKKLKR
jgi:hypothetical protein